MTTHRLRLHAHNFQFLLLDDGNAEPALPVWDDDALERMLAVGPRAAWVGTLRDDAVDVRLDVFDAPRALDLGRVDHASMGSIDVASGRLVVMGSSDVVSTARRVHIAPGCQRFIVTLTGVHAGPAEERYAIEIWPDAPMEPRLLKHW